MAAVNYRTINIDALDPDSSANFDLTTLTPSVQPVAAADVQTTTAQIRQLLRGGDSEGALRGALENAPYGGDAASKEQYAAAVVEVLQSIRQADMSPLLKRVYEGPGGVEMLDVLMKYIYKGMASGSANTASARGTPQSTGFSQVVTRAAGEGGGQTMSVLLSWHEKLVEIVGAGSIVRVMSDRRTV